METTVTTLEAKRDQILEKYYKAEDAVERAETRFFKKYFGSALHPNDTVKHYRTSYAVQRLEKGESYPKEIFTVYIEDPRYGEDNYRVEVNYYTCGSTGDPFEMDRLVSLGKVAEIIKTQGDTIKADYKELMSGDLVKIKSAIREELNQINQEIKDAEAARENRIKEAAIKDFYTAGDIVFKQPLSAHTYSRLPLSRVEIISINKVNRKTVDVDLVRTGYTATRRVNKEDLDYIIGQQALSNNIA